MRALKRGAALAALGGIAIAVLVAAAGTRETTVSQITPDCSHDYLKAQALAFRVVQQRVAALAGVPRPPEDPPPESPEFHDCQKFIVVNNTGGREYTPNVFTILANLSDNEVERLLKAETLLNEAQVADLKRNFSKTKLETLVKANYAWLAGINAVNDYGLGIKQGWNCVLGFPYKTTPNGEQQWFAAMLHECDFARAYVLQAKQSQPVGFTDATKDYPDVARWDWDEEHSTQYIGFGCGAAWCEVGETDFKASDPAPVTEGMNHREKRVRLIKGWHDRQYLAHKVNDVLVPSNVMGIIVPDPLLGEWVDDDFNERREVASIYLFAKSDADKAVLEKYKEKFNLGMRKVEDPSRVYIWGKGQKGPDDWEQRNWRDRYGPFNATRDFVIKRYAARVPIPGVVRWRWSEKDEGTWVRCAAGCCELEG